jgi:hypothetical protein
LAPLSSYSSGMRRADETETEPDDLPAAARTAALESSDRVVPTADDAVEKDRLERAPVEPVEGNEAGAGDAGAAGRSRLFPPLPFLTLLLKQRKRKQAIARSKRRRRGSARGVLSPRLLHRRLHHRAQNRDGNEQHKLLKSKPIKGNKLLRRKAFLVDGLTAQRVKNCVGRQHEAGEDVKKLVRNCLTRSTWKC